MKWKTAARILSVFLSLVLLISAVPQTVYAQEEGDAELTAEAVPAAQEEEETVSDTEAVKETASVQAEEYYIQYFNNDGYANGSWRKAHTAGETVDLSEGKGHVSHSPNPKLDSSTGYCTKYVLDAWNTEKSGTGTQYALTDTLTMPAENVSLYAVWAETEQKHWELTVDGPGSVSFTALRTNAGSEDIETITDGQYAKLYVSSSGKVFPGLIRTGFKPAADEGKIFDGWYFYDLNGEKQDVTVLTNTQLQTLTLTDDIVAAGRNKIYAHFIENDGTYASVTFRESDESTAKIYYQQMVKKGTAMPAVENPTRKNYYFLGWDKEVADTVTEDVVYTAQWLQGPSAENSAEALYTIHCVTGGHEDMTGGIAFAVSGDDIAYDEARGLYTCSLTVDRIGTLLAVGPGCYNIYSGQEHLASEKNPVVSLYWDEADGLWKPDGEQVVEVYHEDGSEPVGESLLSSMSPIICVTETGNAENYKELKLIDGTYELSDPVLDMAGTTYTAAVTITDFDAYAAQLGSAYVPDWDNNLHTEDYYVFYLVREQKTVSIADGTTYLAWSDWGYDKLSTEFQSTGVLHNEYLSGKELLVKAPACTITFTDPLGCLPEQVFEVKAGDAYPEYDWTAVEPWLAEDINAGNPVKIDGRWYVFAGWDGYPIFGGTVSADAVFEAMWEEQEIYTVTFTDGRDGEVFDDVVCNISDGVPPYVSNEDFFYENFPNLDELQLESGEIFIGWDPDPAEIGEITEDVEFTALWDRVVSVIYRDGADGEVFEEQYAGDYLLEMELSEFFPDFPAEDGTEIPEREGYVFTGWEAVEDEEAEDVLKIDGDVSFIVNCYSETWLDEEGNEQVGYYYIVIMEAQWEPETPVEDVPEFKKNSLVLSGEIGVNFFMDLPEIDGVDYTDSYMEFTVSGKGGKTVTDPFDPGFMNQSGDYYGFTCYVNSVQMADTITAVFHYGDGLTVSEEYSVQDYLDKFEANQASFDETTRALIRSIADYGHFAQLFTSEMNGWTIGPDYAEQTTYYTNAFDLEEARAGLAAYAISQDIENSGISAVTQRLWLDSSTTLDVFFKVNEGVEFSGTAVFNGKTYEAEKKADGRYCFRIEGISAHMLGTNVVITGNAGGEYEVQVSVLSYAYKLINSTLGDNAKQCAAALYQYCTAAVNYKKAH